MNARLLFLLILLALFPQLRAQEPTPTPTPTPKPSRPLLSPESPFEQTSGVRMIPELSRRLDSLIYAKFRKAEVRRANPSSDGVFLRRVSIDLTGRIPTIEEARAFLADRNSGKRRQLIERLLAAPEFAEYWGMKWGDALRVKAEFPVNLWPNAAQAYDRWIRDSLHGNVPLSEFATALLTASGSNFRDPAVNFYRASGGRDAESIARFVAQFFLGQRAAEWPEERQKELAAFFTRIRFKKTNEWKEEIVFLERSGEVPPIETKLPDGTPVHIGAGEDPRAVFAKWLVESPSSPFARCMVNRVWFWLFGRSLSADPDDIAKGEPANPELFDWMARQLVSSGYDLKKLLWIIMNSETYQMSCIPRDNNPDAEALMAVYPVRKLDAEVLIDAINQITGTTEEYMSMIPEPFTYLPSEKRAVLLPDGSITSSFLELFGRPPRDTGLLEERGMRITTAQRLHLLNSRHILRKIRNSSALAELMKKKEPAGRAVTNLYLAILSRPPTAGEMRIVQEYSPPGAESARLDDLAWALVNSSEFLYQH